MRRNLWVTFFLSLVINTGMWFERFVIFVTSLHRDFLPSSWALYTPTFVEIGIFIGTLGLLFTCFLIFAKFLPVIALAEVKANMKSTGSQYLGNGHTTHGAEEVKNVVEEKAEAEPEQETNQDQNTKSDEQN